LQSCGGAPCNDFPLILKGGIFRMQGFDELICGRRGRTAAKGRFWSILHGELRSLGALFTKEFRRQGEPEVDARCHASARDAITVDDNALFHWRRTEKSKMFN